jgi:pyruvate/2-oxoglutarate dehydrogenase complex dihydrolipoamide acyltransferase (E2) component
MPTAVRTPRVNNNDDVVKLSHVFPDVGSLIRPGDPLADVETDKATFTVESEIEGYLLAVNAKLGDMVPVGSVLAWIGATPDEAVRQENGDAPVPVGEKAPTLKALLLLKQYGLTIAEVPRAGGQLTAEDVRRYVGDRKPPAAAVLWKVETTQPTVPGRVVPFTPEERGMFRTVSWQREQAAAAYLDIAYDGGPWAAYSAAFQKSNGLWFDPRIALFSWRLARLAVENPRINATVSDAGVRLYDQVNVGCTVQAGSTLYLVVVKDAGRMDELTFVRELSGLQLSALRHALSAEQTSDATVSFSSMARWNVSRHMPVLPPHTALIVADTAPENGVSHLGATYDHRLLTGFDVVQVLQKLAAPPAAKGD